jgi:hypothetical protein
MSRFIIDEVQKCSIPFVEVVQISDFKVHISGVSRMEGV